MLSGQELQNPARSRLAGTNERQAGQRRVRTSSDTPSSLSHGRVCHNSGAGLSELLRG